MYQRLTPYKPRYAFLASLVSLFFPGLGHLYAGRPKRGFAIFFTSLTLPILLGVSFYYRPSLALGAVFVGTFLLLYLFVVIDVALCARAAGPHYVLQPFNRWHVYLATGTLMVVLSMAVSVGFKTVVEAFENSSDSMEPTLLLGDHFFVKKLGYVPKRGDVIVFYLPDDPSTPNQDESDIALVKRAVAIGGDSVEVRATRLIVNGSTVNEPYAQWAQGGRQDFGRATVPANHVFVLGDNRDYSRDSRYLANPFIPYAHVAGKVTKIYWSNTDRARIGREVN